MLDNYKLQLQHPLLICNGTTYRLRSSPEEDRQNYGDGYGEIKKRATRGGLEAERLGEDRNLICHLQLQIKGVCWKCNL